LQINPDLKIDAFMESIYKEEFNNIFFSQFDLVFNALDNQEARRFVSKKCIENDIPLIDAGTGGYNG
jgi:ubiquitin-like 1-activating enzyme E1 B